jgi:hypothetical protein
VMRVSEVVRLDRARVVERRILCAASDTAFECEDYDCRALPHL